MSDSLSNSLISALEQITKLADAAESLTTAVNFLGARPVKIPGLWIYLSADDQKHYMVTSDELEQLSEQFRAGKEGAYPAWRAATGVHVPNGQVAAARDGQGFVQI